MRGYSPQTAAPPPIGRRRVFASKNFLFLSRISVSNRALHSLHSISAPLTPCMALRPFTPCTTFPRRSHLALLLRAVHSLHNISAPFTPCRAFACRLLLAQHFRAAHTLHGLAAVHSLHSFSSRLRMERMFSRTALFELPPTDLRASAEWLAFTRCKISSSNRSQKER